MPDSRAFTTACEALEGGSALNRLETRGTIRIALKQAGLDARSVTCEQLLVVVDKLLPDELESRSIDPAVLELVRESLREMPSEDTWTAESPESVFSRLGG